ncbi:MAG: DUF2272 domain-containing protein [Chitinophagaceae bacterium]|nr:DUF2272 domain-containing protein [Chitinophagaceae bacterium]MCW5903997.1 DUF2272 domain-containing protein [Chitinophagaceae bacterium]
MRKRFVYIFLLIGHFSVAQESVSMLPTEQYTSLNTNHFSKAVITEFSVQKNNLLNIIQQEYCFWNEPKNRTERELSSVKKIKEYWKCLQIFPTTKQVQSFNWQEAHPWSAAFISWCMKSAGYENNFLYAPNHAKYIIWARDNRINKKYENPFWAYYISDNEAANPEPGDLICKNREGKTHTLETIYKTAISHCDIILEVDKANGIVITIGGNVADKVNKRWVFLDTDGYIDTNAAWLSFDATGISSTGSQKDFFTVIKVH